jgi:hypothetical protein
MSMPPIWKRDGFHIHIQYRDYATGEFYWRRANDGDFAVILSAAEAAEREACAKIAEAGSPSMSMPDFLMLTDPAEIRESIAAAIRARGTET